MLHAVQVVVHSSGGPFTSKQAFKVPQLGPHTSKHWTGYSEEWPRGPKACLSPPPNIIQLVLGRLVECDGDLIMITAYLPD